VNKDFNENLTIIQMKSENRYDEVASGSPVKREQRLTRLRREYGFIDRNGKEFRTFSEMEKSTNLKPKPATGTKLLECMTSRLMNEDQKLNYLLLKETKHKKTDTLNQRTRAPKKLNLFAEQFRTSYN
jgi:hypothetical protein